MNIYLVERTAPWGYDEFDAIVIIANNEEEAKSLKFPLSLAPNKPLLAVYLADLDNWYPPEEKDSLRVTKIGHADPSYTTPTIVLASFNAG